MKSSRPRSRAAPYQSAVANAGEGQPSRVIRLRVSLVSRPLVGWPPPSDMNDEKSCHGR